MRIKPYLRIARFDYWPKNAVVAAGAFLPLWLEPRAAAPDAKMLGLAIGATCLLSSANYVLNEWQDREQDRFHPRKRLRPCVAGDAAFVPVTAEYLLLAAAGLVLAVFISQAAAVLSVIFLAIAWLYNAKPFRTKDLPVLDVLTESMTIPLRFMLGWSLVLNEMPAFGIIAFIWFSACVAATSKRKTEASEFSSLAEAALYRKPLGFYTAKHYAIAFTAFSGLAAISITLLLLQVSRH